MADAGAFRCLMMGLPGTGKTTFLAALWHVLKSGEVPGSLLMERREGEFEYLNRIADQWSRCAELERTPSGGQMGVSILLREPAGGSLAKLAIPDMSGELFAAQWETREYTREFADLVASAGGCLLFIHPGTLAETAWIVEANAVYDGWAGGGGAIDGPGQEPPVATAWSPRSAPTQVQLVELLQFLAEVASRRLRVALVVSAWDLVGAASPADWVRDRLPLLWQYVKANPALFEAAFIGVSAQGGRTADAAALLEHATASSRIIVRAEGAGENDITHPIRWVMSAAES